jgi:hypothetical protein
MNFRWEEGAGMRRTMGLVLAAAGLLAASQVFYMTLEESLDFTESVLLVRVESVIEFPGDYMNRIEYYFKVLDVVSGPDSLEGGNEIWESPIVTGSGYEMFIEEGDTVIVFLDRLPDDQQQYAGVIRVDPADSLEGILLLLNPED